jgi:hypothetical protein
MLNNDNTITLRADGISLDRVVETVAEFGQASFELVAWELYVSEAKLEPVWRRAVERGLIHEAGTCWESGERLYEVSGR